MIMYGYSVLDKAADAYMPLFFLPARGLAMRSFADAVNDPKHQFNTHPGDYVLFEMCKFDDQTGACVPVAEKPIRLAAGPDVLSKANG